MSETPNIVMLVPHDLGTHLGCYGAGLETPHIDRLAAEGVMFTNHHCTAAQCSPARGSITTGLYPHNNGLVGLTWGWSRSTAAASSGCSMAGTMSRAITSSPR
jgi:N-sulfoglucosamine sulfohydrolase